MHFTATSIPLHLPLYVSAVDPQPTSSPSSICLTASHIFSLTINFRERTKFHIITRIDIQLQWSFHPMVTTLSFPPNKRSKNGQGHRGIQIAIGFYVLEEQVVIYSYLLFRPDGNQKAHLVG